MFLNILTPVGAPADVGVPPDAEPFRLQRRDERQEPRPVLGLVSDEDVRRTNHCRAPAMTWTSLSHLQRIHKGHGSGLAELKLPNGGRVLSGRHSHEQLISRQQAGSRAASG